MLSYLDSAIAEFNRYETLGRKTMERVSDEELFYESAKDVNSIAVIVKHLHGNMMSRWTDFLTSDGEKEWRQRDGEFEDTLSTREEVYERWVEGWNLLFDVLGELNEEGMGRTVQIRGEDHSIAQAINRQLCHYAYHVGQMVILAKSFKGSEWESLSIPKGKSEEFNEKMKKSLEK